MLRTIGSFAPVEEVNVLNRQPRRIDVIELPEPLSLAAFARRFESAVDLETLPAHQSGSRLGGCSSGRADAEAGRRIVTA